MFYIVVRLGLEYIERKMVPECRRLRQSNFLGRRLFSLWFRRWASMSGRFRVGSYIYTRVKSQRPAQKFIAEGKVQALILALFHRSSSILFDVQRQWNK